MKILIVGAGIGGVSAAIACTQRGHACHVVDLSDRVEGANISFNCKAIDAMAELGIVEDCILQGKASNLPPFAGALDREGRPVAPVVPVVSASGLPQSIAIYRPRLAQILRKRASDLGVEIQFGPSLTTLSDISDGVRATFSDGTIQSYDLIVGADGYRSTVRRMLHGNDLQPQHKNHAIARWVFATSAPIESATYVGPWGIVLVVRTTEDLVYVATDFPLAKGTMVDAEGAQALMRDKLADIVDPNVGPVRDHLGPQSQISVKAYETVFVPAPWHRGRTTLLGDAAHTMTPYLSSGGGMAMEDAVVLAQELTHRPRVEEALDRYMFRRGRRTEKVWRICEDLLAMRQANAAPADQAALRHAGIDLISTPY